jgi:hypothetical protein
MTVTMTVGDLILLDIVSQNETICIWRPIDSSANEALWHGPFWKCPQKYLDTQLDKIFGCIPESIVKADTINILIKGNIPDYDVAAEAYTVAANDYTFETGV